MNLSSDKRGISGGTLKIIAIVSMLIDHIGAVIVEQGILGSTISSNSSPNWQTIDLVMRLIGRIAFPIFCFLLVQGFYHTSNLKKYITRLFLFAALSEIPFDLAFNGKVLEFGYQNVFFTLLIGILAITAMRHFEQNRLLKIIIAFAACYLAVIIKSDYSDFGVLVIIVFYLLHDRKIIQTIAGVVLFLWEITGPIGMVFVHLYNGTRGIRLKYFFYIFYPLHLLILYGILRFGMS